MMRNYSYPTPKRYIAARVLLFIHVFFCMSAISSFSAQQTDDADALDQSQSPMVQDATGDSHLPKEMFVQSDQEQSSAAPDAEGVMPVPASEKERKNHPQGSNSDLTMKAKNIEDQAETYNQKAIHLFEAGRYEEAQQMWQEAIGIIEGIGIESPADSVEDFVEVLPVENDNDEEYKIVGDGDAVEPLDADTDHERGNVPTEQDKQRQEAVEEIYKDAIDLYRSGDYDRAKNRFEEVQWLAPGYRASDKYITQIDNELEYEDHMRPSQAEGAGEQGEEHWEDVIEETEQSRRKELERKAENLYQQAIKYLQEEKLQDAQAKFEETEVFYPGYKNTPQYLLQIERQLLEEQEAIRREEALLEQKLLEREESDFEKSAREQELNRLRETQEKASVLYEKAVQLYKNGQYQSAKIKFEEVNLLCPDYKFTQRYLSRVEQDITREEKALLDQKQRQEAFAGKKEMREWRQVVGEIDEGHEQKLKEEAERIYQQAREHHARGDLRRARLYFQEVGRTVPHYKSVDKFLDRIDEDLVKERRRRLERRYRWKMFIQKREQERSEAIETAQKNKDTDALRQKVEPLYLEAKDLYRQGHFKEAKQKFTEVIERIPDYKSSPQFLSRLDADIRRQEQYQEKKAKRARARKERIRQFLRDQRNKKFDAISLGERKNLGNTLAHIKEARREKVEEKAQMLYEAGQTHYRERLLKVAQETFLEIERIIPDYQSTRKYLARIRSEIDRGEQGAGQLPSLDRRVGVDSREGEEEVGRSSDMLIRAQQDFFQAIKSERLKQQEQAQEVEIEEPIFVSKEVEPVKKKEEIAASKKAAAVDVQMKRATEKAYKEALRYFNKEKFHAAELKIKEAQSYLEDTAIVFEEPFRKAQGVKLQKLRERIRDAAARQPKEKDAAPIDEKKNAPAAVKTSVPVKVLDPSVDETLRGIQGQQAQVRQERDQARKSFQKKLDQIYKEAVRNYKKEKFQEARALFLEIDGVSPDYKKTRNYLEKINRKVTPGTVPQKKVSASDAVPAASSQLKTDVVNEALDQWEAGQ